MVWSKPPFYSAPKDSACFINLRMPEFCAVPTIAIFSCFLPQYNRFPLSSNVCVAASLLYPVLLRPGYHFLKRINHPPGPQFFQRIFSLDYNCYSRPIKHKCCFLFKALVVFIVQIALVAACRVVFAP